MNLEHADRLKKTLRDFALSGRRHEEYLTLKQGLLERSPALDSGDEEWFIDWFMFDWIDDDGDSLIRLYLKQNPGLNRVDADTLLSWDNSISSVFEIKTVANHRLKLFDLALKSTVEVDTLEPLKEGEFFRPGQFVVCRVLPLSKRFIFAGPQLVLEDRKLAEHAMQLRIDLEEEANESLGEGAIEQICEAFHTVFGTDEISIPPSKLIETVTAIHQCLLDSFSPDADEPDIRDFLGLDIASLEASIDSQIIAGLSEVTILCDEFEGLVILPEYQRFQDVFRRNDPDHVPGWKDLVWIYIESPAIPLLAFQHVAESYPSNVERIFKILLEDEDFAIENLYPVLLHFKEPVEWIETLEEEVTLWQAYDGEPSKPAKKLASSRSTKGSAKKTARKKTTDKQGAASKKRSASSSTRGSAKKTTGKKPTGKRAAGSGKATTSRKAAAGGSKARAGKKSAKRTGGGKKNPARKR